MLSGLGRQLRNATNIALPRAEMGSLLRNTCITYAQDLHDQGPGARLCFGDKAKGCTKQGEGACMGVGLSNLLSQYLRHAGRETRILGASIGRPTATGRHLISRLAKPWNWKPASGVMSMSWPSQKQPPTCTNSGSLPAGMCTSAPHTLVAEAATKLNTAPTP